MASGWREPTGMPFYRPVHTGRSPLLLPKSKPNDRLGPNRASRRLSQGLETKAPANK
jgi:hypothetical protein